MSDPHRKREIVRAGTSLEDATAAVVMVHGRGATAPSILQLAEEFDAEGLAYLAPQAARNTWYPNSFLAPIESNEPALSSALERVGDAVDSAADAGIPRERTMLLGFSQGACLASEFVARNPRRYGGLAVLSGGLIGPEVDRADYRGDLEATPVFVGCSDDDPHIPVERVHETTAILDELGGSVTEEIYPDLGHGVNRDELDHVATMVDSLVAESTEGQQ